MKNLLKKGILTLLMALMVAMAVPSILPNETSMNTVEAAQMKINAKKATLVKGQSGKLKIKNATSTVKWKSSNKAVATVNKNGKVTALKKGKATITGTVDGQTFSCVVTVENPKINKTKLTLSAGDQAVLKISGTSRTVTWSSSKKSVAKVSKKGVVTAKNPGTTTITAKVGSKKFQCKVTVVKASDPNITVKFASSLTSKASQVQLKITNNDSRNINVYLGFDVCYPKGVYKNGAFSSALTNDSQDDEDGLLFGDDWDTSVTIKSGKTKTITISDKHYSFYMDSDTFFVLSLELTSNTDAFFEYVFYPSSGKGYYRDVDF